MRLVFVIGENEFPAERFDVEESRMIGAMCSMELEFERSVNR